MDKQELEELLSIVKLSNILELNLNCSQCGEPLNRKPTTGTQVKYQLQRKGQAFFLCRKCLYQKNYNTKTQEEKDRISQNRKQGWANLDNSERQRIKESRSKQTKAVWESRTQEEKDRIKSKILETKSNWTEEQRLSSISKMVESKRNWEEDFRKFFSEKMSQISLEFWTTLSDEEKLKISQKISEGMSSMSLESKQSRTFKLKESLKLYWTETQKEFQSQRQKEYWQNLDSETKAILQERISQGLKAHWESLTGEQRQEVSQKQKRWWNNLTEEQKQEFSQRLLKASKQYWESLTEEQKRKISQKQKEWWNNLTEEKKQGFSQKQKAYWQSLTEEQKREIRRRSSKKTFKSQDGETFDSLWELRYYEYCKSKGFEIIREPVGLEYYYEGEKHTYYPDFSTNGQLIEIKGNHLKDSFGKWICPFKHKSKSQDYMNGLYEAKRQCAITNKVTILYEEDLIALGIEI